MAADDTLACFDLDDGPLGPDSPPGICKPKQKGQASDAFVKKGNVLHNVPKVPKVPPPKKKHSRPSGPVHSRPDMVPKMKPSAASNPHGPRNPDGTDRRQKRGSPTAKAGFLLPEKRGSPEFPKVGFPQIPEMPEVGLFPQVPDVPGFSRFPEKCMGQALESSGFPQIPEVPEARFEDMSPTQHYAPEHTDRNVLSMANLKAHNEGNPHSMSTGKSSRTRTRDGSKTHSPEQEKIPNLAGYMQGFFDRDDDDDQKDSKEKMSSGSEKSTRNKESEWTYATDYIATITDDGWEPEKEEKKNRLDTIKSVGGTGKFSINDYSNICNSRYAAFTLTDFPNTMTESSFRATGCMGMTPSRTLPGLPGLPGLPPELPTVGLPKVEPEGAVDEPNRQSRWKQDTSSPEKPKSVFTADMNRNQDSRVLSKRAADACLDQLPALPACGVDLTTGDLDSTRETSAWTNLGFSGSNDQDSRIHNALLSSGFSGEADTGDVELRHPSYLSGANVFAAGYPKANAEDPDSQALADTPDLPEGNLVSSAEAVKSDSHSASGKSPTRSTNPTSPLFMGSGPKTQSLANPAKISHDVALELETPYEEDNSRKWASMPNLNHDYMNRSAGSARFLCTEIGKRIGRDEVTGSRVLVRQPTDKILSYMAGLQKAKFDLNAKQALPLEKILEPKAGELKMPENIQEDSTS